MRKLLVALMLGLALSPALILFLVIPPANADEPKYNFAIVWGETFPKVKPGATGETTIYFYSAFGNENCYVTPAADNYPRGWSVDFAPENLIVIPQWFENQPFDVGENEVCLSLSYTINDSVKVNGWVRAYPMKVLVTVPKGTLPDKYPVKTSYMGDFRMEGTSVARPSHEADWTVEVEGKPIFPSNSSVLIIIVICAIAVGGSIIAIKRIKSRKKRSRATPHR
jgi:hypothetical protein